MEQFGEVWKTKELSKVFLEGVRSSLPLASEQIDIMLRIIQTEMPNINRFLDLGCGDGVLGRAIMAQYPNAGGVFLDLSEPMLNTAKQKIGERSNACFVLQDFSNEDWVHAVENKAPFDVIVSGFAIHHQPDIRKKALYQEIFDLLRPGGLFLHLEHVASASKWVSSISDELFVDSLYSFHKQAGSTKTRAEIADKFFYRPDKASNILAPVEVQCEWLKESGFINVDCFFKVFEVALFGGMKPN
ncbi:MAG: class I SAM-dependent methyltransferase [Firmicutes bacterium]|nr:class I SAM-dependent methyltransferase [Bacillota bacterium]